MLYLAQVIVHYTVLRNLSGDSLGSRPVAVRQLLLRLRDSVVNVLFVAVPLILLVLRDRCNSLVVGELDG